MSVACHFPFVTEDFRARKFEAQVDRFVGRDVGKPGVLETNRRVNLIARDRNAVGEREAGQAVMFTQRRVIVAGLLCDRHADLALRREDVRQQFGAQAMTGVHIETGLIRAG